MKAQFVLRVRILCAFFILAALLLLVRLYFVQVVHGDEYRRNAESQYVEPDPDTENRGSIFFTTKDDKAVAAAVMQSGWRIAIRPSEITDAEALYAELSAHTTVDKERLINAVAKKDDPYEEVAFRVSDDAVKKIRARKLTGVILVQDQWRLYPGGSLAANVVGFVGYKGSKKTGVYGLERSWQDTLQDASAGLYVNPFAEIFSNVKSALSLDPSAHHGSVVTSIEPSVQHELESTLDEVMKTYTPRIAGGIVMDPRTGEIVAMATRPTYDPNTYNTVEDPNSFSNPLVEGRYELGSIMKPLTMAAGIDSGAVTPATKYNDTGCITRSGKKFCNFDLKARGVVNMQDVLNNSLNLGVTFVADKMGHESFTRYMKAFLLDQRTAIDLPNEVAGSLAPLGNGKGPEVNYAAASFGQGIAISPIEMTRALAILANNGVIPNPHIVTGIKFESGVTRAVDTGAGPRVLSTTTVETVTDMLVEVFDDALLKGELKQEHYSIAAKTGTAQIAIPGGGGYYEDRYLHSFFGYLPAHESRFIVFLFAVEPHGAEFASATLARPFMDIGKFLINYYSIPPDR